MKPLTYLVLIVLLVSALLPVSQPAAAAQAPIARTLSFQNGVAPTAGYAGGRDTYIAEARPDTVSGGERILRLDGDDPPGTGQDLSTLLYWDVSAIPPGSTVREVTLEFTVTNTAAGSYSAFELKHDWTENEATWVNRLAGSPWQVPGANGTEDRGTEILGDLAPRAAKASFGLYPLALAVVQRWVDDPSANHGLILLNSNQSDGAAMISNQDANAANHPKLTVVFDTPSLEPTPAGENRPPVVNAGKDFEVTGYGFNLHGTVSDDGLPADPGQVTYHWDVILAYPYTQELIQFDENDLNTFVLFPKYGRIGFRLTATDGEHTVSDEVYINVLPEPDQVNDAPSIYNFEGPNEVRLPNTGKYVLDVIDDGLPIPPNDITFTWSTASGPAPVTFSDPHERMVTATFSQPGDYVLQVDLFDGELTNTNTYPVRVLSEILESRTIHFQQGRAPTSSYSGAADTYLSQHAPTTRFGSAAKLRVDGDDPPGTGRDLASLLYWDLSAFPGDPERIVEAAITIYVTNPSSGPFYLYALNRPFAESQATWQQAASGEPWSAPGANDITAPDQDRRTEVLAIFKPTTTAFYTARFTSEGLLYLQQALTGSGAGNWGLILTHPSTTDGLDFYSRNYANPKYRPVLSIRYEVAD
ncbi:MAG TPA: DNRLRE domain-containing protein [Anaerolineaceae bacterium]|nr:DNRLRE domain-containing protein [Anaerolineaceae bacterium]